MGTKEVLHLFDELVLSNTTESPYQAYNTKVFTTKTSKDTRVLLSLPFTVEQQEVVYVGLTDLSMV